MTTRVQLPDLPGRWAGLPTALCFGMIAFWGSENLFWTAPPDDIGMLDLVMTWVAYSLAVAAAIGAVIWSGLGGWRALFMGGALLGWLAEGVIVGTTYEAFPVQLVWTPLAWHAAITGLLIGSLCRAGPYRPLWRHLAAVLGLAFVGIVMAQYWPLERTILPGIGPVLLYLAGVGMLVVLGNWMLDRMVLPASPTWIHKGAALLFGLIWSVQSIAAPSLLRLSVPVLIGVTLWAMRRLGSGQRTAGWPDDRMPTSTGPAPIWRHALFMIAPVSVSFGAVVGWQAFGGVEVWLLAVASSAIGTGLWLWLVAQAAVAPRR